jgi:alpha-glucosidase
VLDIVAMMRRVVDTYEARVLLDELYLPIERLIAYYGVEGPGVHLPGNFHLIQAHTGVLAGPRDCHVNRYPRGSEVALPAEGWPNWVLGNHDKSRLASRLGPAQACVAAMLLLTLCVTPILYYGDELSMGGRIIPPECVQDSRENTFLASGSDAIRRAHLCHGIRPQRQLYYRYTLVALGCQCPDCECGC